MTTNPDSISQHYVFTFYPAIIDEDPSDAPPSSPGAPSPAPPRARTSTFDPAAAIHPADLGFLANLSLASPESSSLGSQLDPIELSSDDDDSPGDRRRPCPFVDLEASEDDDTQPSDSLGSPSTAGLPRASARGDRRPGPPLRPVVPRPAGSDPVADGEFCVLHRDGVFRYDPRSVGSLNAVLPGRISYLVFQLERCPDTGRLHLQGYFHYARGKRARFSRALRDLSDLGFPRSHVESARGNPSKCRAYCIKPDSRVLDALEFGDCPVDERGRSDLLALRDAVLRGTPFRTLLADDSLAVALLRHGRAAQLVRSLQAPQERVTPQSVSFCLVGPTACGKSQDVFAISAQYPGFFHNQCLAKWLDGYDNHPGIIFDEYTGGAFEWTTILSITGGYPYRLEQKGGSCALLASTFIFTSNKHPSTWEIQSRDIQPYYPNQQPTCPLIRRFTPPCGRIYTYPQDRDEFLRDIQNRIQYVNSILEVDQ